MFEASIYERFGQLVRQHRDRLDMSQEVLSAAIGLSRASVANIESGRQHIPLHHLFRLARALQVDPAALLPTDEEQLASAVRVAISATQELNDREQASVARVVGSIAATTRR